MLCFYINLDRRPDRRAAIEAQLGAVGLEATRISAVTPETTPPDLARKWCRPHRPRGLAWAELACSLSHHAAWRELLSSSEPMALVLEDDASLSIGIASLLARVQNEPATFDVLRIETRHSAMLLERRNALSIPGATAHRIKSKISGTAGYIITRSGAEKLLAVPDLLGVPIDHAVLRSQRPRGPIDPLQLIPGFVTAPGIRGRDSDLDAVRPRGSRLRKRLGRLRRKISFFLRPITSGGALFVSRVPLQD